jgi:hypothetical protein
MSIFGPTLDNNETAVLASLFPNGDPLVAFVLEALYRQRIPRLDKRTPMRVYRQAIGINNGG